MASSEPRFVRLYPGPTLQWGGEAKSPGGIAFSQRYCGMNMYGLTDDGRVFALAWDYALGTDGGPRWVRIGGDGG